MTNENSNTTSTGNEGWEWQVGRCDGENHYDIGCGNSREDAIKQGMATVDPDESFQIIEAISAGDDHPDWSEDWVPFLQTRNHEIITKGAEQ